MLNCKLERSTVDVEQIDSRFDLALHYYLCPLLRYWRLYFPVCIATAKLGFLGRGLNLLTSLPQCCNSGKRPFINSVNLPGLKNEIIEVHNFPGSHRSKYRDLCSPKPILYVSTKQMGGELKPWPRNIVSQTLPLYFKAAPVPFLKSGQTLMLVAVIYCHQLWVIYRRFMYYCKTPWKSLR